MHAQDFNFPELWYDKFLKVAKILKEFYSHIVRDNALTDLEILKYATFIEKAQHYPWTYIDYGFRVPIYRTMQWLFFNLDVDWSKTIGRKNERKTKNKRRTFIIDLHKHLLKEYLIIWFKVLSIMRNSRAMKILNNIIKEILKTHEEPIEMDKGAFYDLIGLENELKACYVLIDHNKPFLPFSIMQAPITPSYIRPGASSGDLYLFEENLVIDVKGGWLDGKTKLPTYYYDRKNNLSQALRKASDLHYLYGIRKGIGVVAEDKDHIHLAVYVPWRGWRTEGPLIHLRSVKLPFLIYVNRYGDRGAEPYGVFKEAEKFIAEIDAYVVERERIEEIKDKLYAVIEGDTDQLKLKPKVSVVDRTLRIRLEIKDANISNYIITAMSGEDEETVRLVFTRLVVDQDNLAVNYPIIMLLCDLDDCVTE